MLRSLVRGSPVCAGRQLAGRAQRFSAPRAVASGKAGSAHILEWLKAEGGVDLPVEIRTMEPEEGRPLDAVVAKGPISVGDVILDVPEHLIISLDRIFESTFVAELLTNDKLSELAILTLYLMYEKKTGPSSFWSPFIKELDRQRGRGPQAVASPLLWEDSELTELLQGSPLLPAVRQRLAGIHDEYEALDTVWFMASSLFKSYPFDMPTEAFPFELFKQAFAAVQASIVHLQGVTPSKRFALVPLGPPLMSYSSTAKAVIGYNAATRSVRLVADRSYAPGEPLQAWCGPQPNSRLLLNYGIVDEDNPYDKLQMTVTLPTSDPLFKSKRDALQPFGLSTQSTFDLSRSAPLPPALLPYMRLALATSEAQITAVLPQFPPAPAPRGKPSPAEMAAMMAARADAPASRKPDDSRAAAGEQQPGGAGASSGGAVALPAEAEARVGALLAGYLNRRLAAYKNNFSRDIEIIGDASAPPRARIAARLTKIEKSILMGTLEAVHAATGGRGALPDAYAAAAALSASSIKFT